MTWKQCPICFGALEVRNVAPCDECGGDPVELEHFWEGRHTYQRVRVFSGLDFELTLCNFCAVDFGSSAPAFFGLPRNARIGFERMQLVHDVEPTSLAKDKFCVNCNARLTFLTFVADVREHFAAERAPSKR